MYTPQNNAIQKLSIIIYLAAGILCMCQMCSHFISGLVHGLFCNLHTWRSGSRFSQTQHFFFYCGGSMILLCLLCLALNAFYKWTHSGAKNHYYNLSNAHASCNFFSSPSVTFCVHTLLASPTSTGSMRSDTTINLKQN